MRSFEPVPIDDLLPMVQKPSRYVGGEVNAIRKNLREAALTWVLAFPDQYEVGMSNLGFRVLYHVLNRRPDTAAERSFMPGLDLAERMRERGLPLFSWESRAPLRDFDVIGFSLQYELCYTTVLAMLELAGLPLFAKDRGPEHPLVVGGGPCAYAPEPMAPFFDLYVVGEAEEVVHELNDLILAWKESGGSREELLWEAAEIQGIYVPSLLEPVFEHGGPIREFRQRKAGYAKAVRRVVPDLNAAPFYEKPVLPFMETIHDRLPVEIQRGCTRGCRFCQVGMLTRPTRQRDPKEVLRLAMKGYESTGYEEVSFLSLSAGDYQCLNGMLEDFLDELEPERISVGIPSLRTETMNRGLAEQIRRVRKGGFTVAPEAATERMRRVINKGNDEADLLHAVETIYGAGWDLVKLYFMIGLPTERDEDVLAIGELAHRVVERGRRYTKKARVNVGVSTFVPKPHTPFQWEAMIPLEETKRRQELLRQAFGPTHAIQFRYPEGESSRIEALLALGDRRVSTVILSAYRRGQVLDGWSEHFRYEVWLEAAAEMEREHGVGIDFFAHREKGKDEVLPWDVVDCEVTKPYLWRERERSFTEAEVVDCAIEPCHICGACDYEVVKNRVYDPKEYIHVDGRRYDPEPVALPVLGSLQSEDEAARGEASEAARQLVEKVEAAERRLSTQQGDEVAARLRIRFAKEGRAVALSHLETATAIIRALRRARVPLAFTQGMTPRPRLSLGPALPVGVESVAEMMDLELGAPLSAEELVARLGPELPEGFRLLGAEEISRGSLSLQRAIDESRYLVRFPESFSGCLESGVARFEREEIEVLRERKPKRQRRGRRPPTVAPPRRIRLRDLVSELDVQGEREIVFSIRNDPDGSVRPSEVVAALFGDGALPEGVRIRKEAVTLRT